MSPSPWQILMGVLVGILISNVTMDPDHPQTQVSVNLGVNFVVAGTCHGYLLWFVIKSCYINTSTMHWQADSKWHTRVDIERFQIQYNVIHNKALFEISLQFSYCHFQKGWRWITSRHTQQSSEFKVLNKLSRGPVVVQLWFWVR